ncbi:C-glycoside deglycosidase beta subunit domain-containing protein [Actinoplanes sp. CA-030573]|uniref:C-glycoside deglycosidase beta subunit domain-containing protein n=1 Tax=Actinoplanes sp. CA-030573 TaxID=3239898 RepID=UPI003D906840
MMPELILEPDSLQIHGDRVRVNVRMPWYRALPLSSVAEVRWTVDGRAIDRDSITWTVDGATYRLDELPPRHDKWWYVLDPAVIEGDLGATTGGRHEVAVTLALYIPYITTDHGVLLIEESDVKEMAA